MNLPEDLLYTKDHEWLKVSSGIGTIGITDYAQSELGDIVFVDIDPDLKEIKKSESFGTIEAVKTVSDLFAPVSGQVMEINPDLEADPQKINSDPYSAGWILKIEINDEAELKDLLSAEEYGALIG